MSLTILETLENAEYNIERKMIPAQLEIGKHQLHNAITLLRKGYDLHELIDPIIDVYPNIDDAPER